MLKQKFKIQISSNKEDHDSVLSALLAYNAVQVGPSGKTELTFQIKSANGQLIAGANAFTHWNYFFLAHLWVSEEQRGQGIGKQLIQTIELEAKSRNCTHCWLDTFSFQAAGFYEKLGYKKFGQLEDYPIGHQRYFFFKELGPLRM